MVNPAWFFSTLSQGIAAIVGLLVSARLIQYQLERQRRERRTEDLREEIQDFDEKFGHILSPMAGTFAESADLSFWSQSRFLWLSGDKLNFDIAINSPTPVVTMYWIHMARISHVLMTGIYPSPNPRAHYLFSQKEFDRLRESITWLKENVDERSLFIEYLYADLGIQGNKPYTANVFNPDPPGESLQDWLQRYQDYATRHSTLLSGKNLQSYQRVFGELHRDFQRLDSLRQNTIITFNPGINTFLAKVSSLILVGVILPLAAITSDVPDLLAWLVIDSTLLYLYEIVLLSTSTVLIFVLLDDLQQEFGTTSFPEYLKETIGEYQQRVRERADSVL
ncbi:hypothetical protein [Haloprofundus halophilus]|uniref:hypothetical protein n=1 Tax=Haloprofundus halophilus TaxID=2283527 RepID=UPI0013003DCA|nr:hypothetical protein [Haloprofundus halophilus]